jgi:hypothetical protein
MEIKTDDPKGIEKIMKGFEEIWPKIIFYDPAIEPYYGLMQNVYAQGMLNTFQYVSEKKEETQTIH